MDLISALQTVNRSTLTVLSSINLLNVVQEKDCTREESVRLKETAFVMTDRLKRGINVASAYNLAQYRNHFYSIKLEEDTNCWLLELLKTDDMED